MTQNGFTATVIDGELAVAPLARVTPALQAELGRHRTALIALLSGTAKTSEQPIPRTYAEIRAAYAALNAKREAEHALASAEAARQRERRRFEAAKQEWAAADEMGRRRRQEDLDTVFEAGDDWRYRRGY